MQLSSTIKALTLVVLLNAIAAIELAEFAAATPYNSQPIQLARRRLNFRIGVRPSRYRVGGYSRAATCDSDKKLLALVPPAQPEEKVDKNKAPVDKTIAEHPIFFVYLPTELATGPAEFTLQTEAQTKGKFQDKNIFQKPFTLTGKAGMVGIALPQSVSLQIGQKYLWQMTVNCNTDPKANKLVVIGWVERVKLAAAGGDKLTTLAEAEIWQDTMSTLALRRYEQPDDRTAAEDWASLMEAAKMPEFKDTAIVQIVKD
jgi:hypothetical protein